MTYATISEAWGGLSGSHMTQTPLKNNELVQYHPAHRKQIKRKRKEHVPRYKTQQDKYNCMYGLPNEKENCNQIYQRNKQFNDEQKNIATGIQPIPPGSIPYGPGGGFTLLPQYPWYNWNKYNYMMYSPHLSSAYYNHPFMYNPQVAQQIEQYQRNGNIHYYVPSIYSPQGFMPGYYPNPPYSPPPNYIHNKNQNQKGVEHFTNLSSNTNTNSTKNITIVFIFFLIVLSIILCMFLLAFSCSSNNSLT